MPIDYFTHGTGPHEEQTKRGGFRFGKDGKTVVWVWNGPAEEAWFRSTVLEGLKGTDREGLSAELLELQAAGTRYANEAAQYRFDTWERFKVPLGKIEGLRRSGFGGPFRDEVKRAVELLNEGPRLRSRIAGFAADVRLAVAM